jgi:hypothetical protein
MLFSGHKRGHNVVHNLFLISGIFFNSDHILHQDFEILLEVSIKGWNLVTVMENEVDSYMFTVTFW